MIEPNISWFSHFPTFFQSILALLHFGTKFYICMEIISMMYGTNIHILYIYDTNFHHVIKMLITVSLKGECKKFLKNLNNISIW